MKDKQKIPDRPRVSRKNIRRFAVVVLVAVFVVLLLSGCAASPSSAPRSAGFGECIETTITVTIVPYDSVRELHQAYNKATGDGNTAGIKGFARAKRDLSEHWLHVLRPNMYESSEELNVLGHELMHAVCGDWH